MVLYSFCSYYYSISSLHVQNAYNNLNSVELSDLDGYIFDWNGKIKVTYSNIRLKQLPDDYDYHLIDDYSLDFTQSNEYVMYFDDVNNKLTHQKTKYELRFTFDENKTYDFMIIFNGFAHKVHFL